MQMAMRGSIQRVGLCAVLPAALWGGLAGPVPVDVVERQADVIVVATMEGASARTKAAVEMQLRIANTIKGQVTASVQTVELTPSAFMSSNASSPQDLVPKSVIGATGIWFLKARDSTYQVLPLATGDFIREEEVFLRLRSPEVPLPAIVIPGLAASGDRTHQLVLAALVDSYLSAPNPGDLRNIMAASLNREHLEDSLAAAKVLIASDSPDHQIVGLEAALRLGSDEALQWLAEKAPTLQSHRMFPFLSFVLSTEYKPNGEASIAPLRQLAALLHGSGINFDAPIAAALRKIATKAVVPAMVELLDSQDPTAQLHAAHFLSEYAQFADANGNIPVSTEPGRVPGPWGTEATQAHMPSPNSTMTTQDYASFWKWWWAENKAKLGFPGP